MGASLTSGKSGWVALAGRPNAGKSTLLNRMVGSELSIVSPKAQTTRDLVRGYVTGPLGQIAFLDAPGIHSAKPGGLNEAMVRAAEQALADADLVWYLVDPGSAIEHERPVIDRLARFGVPAFLIVNKVDLRPASALEETVRAALGERALETHRVSALKGQGIPALLEATWSRLPTGGPLVSDPETLSDRPMRFFAAERIRAQCLRQLGEEVPYSCAIEITKYDESSKPTRIEATIHVERESQKGMVIGKGGAKIREIGTSARQEIEKLAGEPIFLGLQVKVSREWSRDARFLERLGYRESVS